MVEKKNEQGEVYYTTEGIYLMVGSNEDTDGDLFFEPMAFILNFINTYTDYIKEN